MAAPSTDTCPPSAPRQPPPRPAAWLSAATHRTRSSGGAASCGSLGRFHRRGGTASLASSLHMAWGMGHGHGAWAWGMGMEHSTCAGAAQGLRRGCARGEKGEGRRERGGRQRRAGGSLASDPPRARSHPPPPPPPRRAPPHVRPRPISPRLTGRVGRAGRAGWVGRVGQEGRVGREGRAGRHRFLLPLRALGAPQTGQPVSQAIDQPLPWPATG